MHKHFFNPLTVLIFLGFALGLLSFSLIFGVVLADESEMPDNQPAVEFVDEHLLADGAVYRIIKTKLQGGVCYITLQKQMQERMMDYNILDTVAVVFLYNSELPVAIEDLRDSKVHGFNCNT